VELSGKDRRQKVDRACRDAKKNSVVSAGTVTSRESLQEPPKVNTIDNSGNPSFKWEGREISTNTEDGRTCTQSSTLKRARPPSPSTSVLPVVLESNSNNSKGDDNHNSIREPSQTPWRYHGTAPFLNTVTNTGTGACTAAADAIGITTAALLHGEEERPRQQLWSELHRTGYQQPFRNEAMQGTQDDGNYRNHALRSSSLVTFEKVPATIAPTLEYSCGSLVCDASSCGSDHNMDQTSPLQMRRVTSPNHTLHTYHRQMAFHANSSNSYVWSTKFISMDLNESTVSAMDEDCSSVSLDFFNILGDGTESSSHDDLMVTRTIPGKDPTVARNIPGNVGEENYPSRLTLLDSSVSGTDLSSSYKPSTFSESNHVLTIDQEESRFYRSENTTDSDPNVLQRNAGVLYQARYVCLKREESFDTAITGNLKRCSKVVLDKSDDWKESSLNMSLDFNTVPSTTKEVQVKMPSSAPVVRRNDNWSRNTNNNSPSIIARSCL
jgi:hypothetical protein